MRASCCTPTWRRRCLTAACNPCHQPSAAATQALAKFSKLRHLDISYSSAPGSIADVAAVVAQLPELEQLHARGIGLSGGFTCDLVAASK